MSSSLSRPHHNPPSQCDICEDPFPRAHGSAFYDARIPNGPWANLCRSCARVHRVRLGTGFGQLYTFNAASGKFECGPRDGGSL